MKSFKKHIAIISFLVLLIPSTIQLAHVFENHKHSICNSVNEKHFHDNSEVDCSQLHYQFKIFSAKLTSNYEVIPQHLYSDIFIEQPQKNKVVYFSKKKSRGPPFLLM